MTVHGKNGRQVPLVSEVVSLLTAQGIPFRDLRTEQPNLEDVFLSLTGRADERVRCEMKSLLKMTWMEAKLFLREPVGAFFTLVFPLMMLFIVRHHLWQPAPAEHPAVRGRSRP